MAKNNVIIEFAGLPGSGKTTIQRYFRGKYKENTDFQINFVDKNGNAVVSVKFTKIISFIFRNPILVLQMIKFWGRSTNLYLKSLPQLIRCIKLAIKAADWKEMQNISLVILSWRRQGAAVESMAKVASKVRLMQNSELI